MSITKEDIFYIDSLTEHVESLKKAIEMNTEVIRQKVEANLSEDKYVNVIKSRRMASDDNLYYYEEIKRIEKIINGEESTIAEVKEGEEVEANPIGRHKKK